MGGGVRRDGRSGLRLHPFRPHTRSNSCQQEIAEIRICARPPPCTGWHRSASLRLRYDQHVALPLADCPRLCMQKSHRDRRGRRVHIGASYSSIAAEHCLDLLIGRQVSPGSALFDNLPFFIADVVTGATLLNVMDEPREPFLVVWRPSQHAIENFFDLILCHASHFSTSPTRTTTG
jgi:hypothetical protein